MGIERHRIRVCVNDPVTWTFDNQCDEELDLEIGNFHIDAVLIEERKQQGIDITKEARDPIPFVDLTNVRVKPRQRGSVKAVAKINITYDARTYKYDIIDRRRGSALLDPESEIYN